MCFEDPHKKLGLGGRRRQTEPALDQSPRPKENVERASQHQQTARQVSRFEQTTDKVREPQPSRGSRVPASRPPSVATPVSSPAAAAQKYPFSSSTQPEGHGSQPRGGRGLPLPIVYPPLTERPSDVSSYGEPDSPSEGRGKNAKVPKNSVGIGIETEFLLQARAYIRRRQTASLFSDAVAKLHNKKIPTSNPRMRSVVSGKPLQPSDDFETWTLMGDITIDRVAAPWGIEMASPLFRAYRGSRWREEVDRTWAFLQKHYRVTTNNDCGTHIHISIRRGFSLSDLKRIGQCVIHFEPAIEALVPQERRGNSFMKSNWLDNRRFGLQNKSPHQAIQEIGQASTRQEVVGLMCPGACDNYFAWNFRSLQRLRTIEFRKASPSRTAQDALMWAEFAMTFILSAMQTEDTVTYLNRTQPNVDGLKQFLLQDKEEPHMCHPEYLKPLWVGKTGKESVQPTIGGRFSEKFQQLLEEKRQAESRRYLRLSQVEQAWMSA